MFVELLLRWIHILAAIILLGGTFYQRFALIPALLATGLDNADLAEACRGRWSKWVMASSGLLLVTGLFNAIRIISGYDFEGGLYHGLVLAKLVIALCIFWISAVLAGRSSLAEKFREKIVFWLTVNVALSVLIVCLAGYMRMEKRVEKPDTRDAATSSTFREDPSVDKKAKKRLEILRQRLQKLHQQLSGARQQEDEPGEVQRIESEIASVQSEVEKLKAS